MGYWNGNEEGHSFCGDLTWGDWPADIFDKAIDDVIAAFKEDVGREPTKVELMAGFKFSWNPLEELRGIK